jgi:hypothetical protein
MRFSTLLAAILASAALNMAIPLSLEERQANLGCSGTTSNTDCCATDVLGLADLDCAPRKSSRLYRCSLAFILL